jgi:hypothetical protein
VKIEKLVGEYEKSNARPRPQFIKQLTGSGLSDNSCNNALFVSHTYPSI